MPTEISPRAHAARSRQEKRAPTFQTRSLDQVADTPVEAVQKLDPCQRTPERRGA